MRHISPRTPAALAAAALLLAHLPLTAATVRGIVQDAATGEALVGATVALKGDPARGAVCGLNGRFAVSAPLSAGALVVRYMGYRAKEVAFEGGSAELAVSLEPESRDVGEVVVYGDNARNTEVSARSIEKNAINVINVMSAKAIELSPDVTVASAIQRMSGVTMERNSSGDGQYAILRGMDKRFSYTLVNGVKIPSPDNKNRFVPLDIFPAELLDRLEVTKALTADMEADGIGGAVNMVMKDAPSQRLLTAHLSGGANSQLLSRSYRSFDAGAINRASPNEKYGLSYPIRAKDFTTGNLRLSAGNAAPSVAGGVAWGDRVFRDRLGVMLAGSYANEYRGSTSDMYGNATLADGQQQITKRYFSTRQTRLGAHAKLDYRLPKGHKLMWYNAYMDFSSAQVRDAQAFDTQTLRLRWNHQTIFSSTLKGMHCFADEKLRFDWSLAYGAAFNETPDNVQINEHVINQIVTIDQNTGATRRWEHNADKDKVGYASWQYSIAAGEATLLLAAGGMYRDKVRDSYFNEYTFKPYDESLANPRELIKGVHWSNFDEICFEVNAHGNLSDPLNYDATERVSAGYLLGNLTAGKWRLAAGLHVEHTSQGYFLKFPVDGAQSEGSQRYADYLPDVHVSRQLHKNAKLRFSYVKAINRPSFFEIVPYSMIHEEYKERGNPELKHTVADNFDLRYEYFPRPSEQLMLGLFYKKIDDPIEFGMMSGFGQDTYYMPMNFGSAHNYGFEVDAMKYFSWFGLKANYTFTGSNITTVKMRVLPNPDPSAETNYITEYVNQARPLFGQAKHVVNVSLLVKEAKYGWDGQLAFSYTGDRLCIVSRYLNEDRWQAGYIRLDASLEKQLRFGLAIFAKATNLLNTQMLQYVKANESSKNVAGLERYRGGIVERKERYGQVFFAGIKYKLQ
ncbi:MAG: TonB-dependent receptor [Prevotellaceae bacterium]|jgi:outer membrane receptor protein involved in Fe transport|nr:TonB-dependent receptor [Prevotellaceae bacterium]